MRNFSSHVVFVSSLPFFSFVHFSFYFLLISYPKPPPTAPTLNPPGRPGAFLKQHQQQLLLLLLLASFTRLLLTVLILRKRGKTLFCIFHHHHSDGG
jgi:hypothetical protein